MACRNCTTLPVNDRMNIIAYMNTNAEHLDARLRRALHTLKYHYKDAGAFLMVNVPNLELFVSEIDEGEFFDDQETDQVFLLPTEVGQFFDFSLFSETHPLTYWRALYDYKAFTDILHHGRIVTQFQPIVASDNLERYGYEALSRGLRLDGRHMSAFELFEAASVLHLTANLDKVCRESAIRHGAKQQIHNKLFINFMPNAICTPDICLSSTIQMATEYSVNTSQLVFEAVGADQLDSTSHLREIFTHLKGHQCVAALDDVGSQTRPFEVYNKLESDYLIIDMQIIRGIHLHAFNQAVLERLLQYKETSGVTLIAKGVEREEEFAYLRTKAIDYMQGYYFGKPESNLL